MELYLISVASAIAIALIYMLFDVFNRRNIPSGFAYGTLAFGFILTMLYLNSTQIALSLAIAAVILGVGYILFRIGQLGAADVMELAALSLIMPFQRLPLIASGIMQNGMPLIISIIVNAGIAAIIIVPIYYLPKARKVSKKPLGSFVGRSNVLMSLVIIAAYFSFIAAITFITGINYMSVAVLLILLLSSASVMLFSVPINMSMIRVVGVDSFEDGDIVALNLMSKGRIERMKKQISGFGRLMAQSTIDEMKRKKISGKFPVYKDAMPFALPIFVAVVLTFLVGNVLLFIL